jgi:hypothetical protein
MTRKASALQSSAISAFLVATVFDGSIQRWPAPRPLSYCTAGDFCAMDA